MYSALIVDDIEVIRFLVALRLKRWGFTHIFMAANGAEALEQLSIFLPDVIFTDFNMPNMDGTEFITKLRSNPMFAHVPVVLMSGYDFDEDEKSAFTRYIKKPFTGADLDAVIRSLGYGLGNCH